MSFRQVCIALSALSLVVAGCLFDHTAEKIAEMRKSGDVEAARAKAIQVLKGKSEKMDVWRELVMTDAELSRKAVEDGADPLSMLVEASLICASVNAHAKGKPDPQWEAAGIVVCAEVVKRITFQIGRLELKYGTESSGAPHYEADWGETGDFGPQTAEQFRKMLEERSQAHIDPQVASDAIRQTAILTEFLKRLPCDNPQIIIVTLKHFADKIRLITADTNLTPSFVKAYSEPAVAEVEQAVAAAVDDLETQGSLGAETIFSSRVLE